MSDDRTATFYNLFARNLLIPAVVFICQSVQEFFGWPIRNVLKSFILNVLHTYIGIKLFSTNDY